MADRKIVISGAGGFIGRPLAAALRERGDEVVELTRGPAGPGCAHWDPTAGEIDHSALAGASAVVHLAGESLSGLWTGRKKTAILESRRRGTSVLASAVAAMRQRPEVFVSASAVGYYGDRGDAPLDERAGPGDGFLADVVRQWEGSCQTARDAGIRVVNLRMGLVLGRGGVVSTIRPLFRLGAGGRLGGGRQWWSWVSLNDAVRAFLFAIDDRSADGPYNVTAPEPVTNAEFTRVFARVVHRPAIAPAPRFALRLALRGMADEMLLASQRAQSTRLRAAGFEFADIDLAAVLEASV